ncbi:MAG: RidA family protein [Gammaproteobacteria bacterium]|nr:RidA family protein [Gammaproteobacteria bacterium]
MADWKRREVRVPDVCEPISHYTDAVRFGNVLFLSGMVGVDAKGRVIGKGDVVAQARATFANMQRILEAEGASFADVLKVTVYLRNVEDRARINPVRAEFFGDARPASTLVEVSKLVAPELLIEVEAVAGLPQTE